VNAWCALWCQWSFCGVPHLADSVCAGRRIPFAWREACFTKPQSNSLPSPDAGEGVGLRQFSLLVFIVESEAFAPIRYRFLTEVSFRPMSAVTFLFHQSINQHFATHRSIKLRIADKLLHLNTQHVHFHQADNVFQMEQTHDHHLHHPL
jgi:hypothetical protein